METVSSQDLHLSTWRDLEKKALELLQIVGRLRFDRSIELVLFRTDLYDQRPSEIINAHQLARHYIGKAQEVDLTLSIAKSILNNKTIGPSKIDVGRMATEYLRHGSDSLDIDDFIHGQLSDMNQRNTALKPTDVVLYGFGRIGRVAARRIIELTGRGQQLRLRAIVVRPKLKDQQLELKKRLSLLEVDSVHGNFKGAVILNEDGQLYVNGNHIEVIYAQSPSEIDYTEYGIQDALLIDNTGVWRDKEALKTHLRPGIKNVLLTAPANDIPNIVYGCNHENVDLEKDQIFSAASCTTNAISPILKAIREEYGIERGHVETIHAYTSDQNLLDNFHKKPRRGRGAAVNMVLTSTGAAKAVAKVIPELAGKLTGNAVRVPTPNVSLAILSIALEKATSVEEVNDFIREASLQGPLMEQIAYSTNEEYVSSHVVGVTSTSVLDAPSTIVSSDGKHVHLYIWYDNEYGYTCQVIRLAKHIAKVRRAVYY